MVPPYLSVSPGIPKEHNDYLANLEQLWADRYSIHLHVWEPNDWPEIINYLNQNGCPFYLVDYLNVFAPEDRIEFVLILRKEKTPHPVLPNRLPEKGPFRWYAAPFSIEPCLLIPLINSLLFCQKRRAYKITEHIW